MADVRIAIDCMGGDNAPYEIVKGVLEALVEDRALYFNLVGKESEIKKVIAELMSENAHIKTDNIEITDATEIIETAEHPVNAIRTKKDSSMVKGLHLLKENEADAFLSAGNTGALLVGGQTIAGRMKGVDRACLAPCIPTPRGPVVLVDAGANMDARPAWLLQWAKMGSVYASKMFEVKKPRVSLVNVGEEEEKGNKLVQDAFPLLRNDNSINFTGSIEARDISAGDADVIVCDAFVGNVILKMYEGVAKTLLSEIKNAIYSSAISKLGGALIKKSLKGVLNTYNAASYGGAVLLGTKGLIVKAHGNSEARQIVIAIRQISGLLRKNILADMADLFNNTGETTDNQL